MIPKDIDSLVKELKATYSAAMISVSLRFEREWGNNWEQLWRLWRIELFLSEDDFMPVKEIVKAHFPEFSYVTPVWHEGMAKMYFRLRDATDKEIKQGLRNV